MQIISLKILSFATCQTSAHSNKQYYLLYTYTLKQLTVHHSKTVCWHAACDTLSTHAAKFGIQANSARCDEGGAVRRHAPWG